MKHNPDGVFVMNARRPSWDWLTDYASQARLSTICLMDANREAGNLQRKSEIPYVCHRAYSFIPNPPENGSLEDIRKYANERFDDVRNLRDDSQNGNVLHEINCEQGFSSARMYMYAFMIERSIELNDIIGMVFWNGASGSVTTGFWGQPNQWEEPGAQYYLHTMHKYRNIRLPNGAYAYIHGTHYYTSQYPLIAVNGATWAKGGDMWNAYDCTNLWDLHDRFALVDHIDFWSPQDHLVRDFQGQMYSLGWKPTDRGNGFTPTEKIALDDDGFPVYAPWTISTEHGFDNMNDVRKRHWNELIFMDQYDTPRGFRSLEKTWEQPDWFPGQTAGKVLAWCNSWTYCNIFRPTGVHLGGHTYAIGDTSGPNLWWRSFNLWNNDTGAGPAHDYFEFAVSDAAQIEMPDHFFADPGTLPDPEEEPQGCLPKQLRALLVR